jgi:hypothetical protein
MQHDCVSRCSQNSVVEPQTSCLPFGSTSCDALPSRSRQHCWIDSQAVRHVHRWSRTDDSTQGDRSLRGVRRNLVSGSPAIPPIVFPIGIAGNLLGSWRLFGFSQNHKDWGIYRDHHTIFPSSVIPPHIFPRAKAVLRRVEGEFHFALPLRLLGAVLLVPPLLGSGEVLVPVPPVCCGKQLAAFGF